ncbi:hypothetical protein CJ191_03880 [Aerococcus viridans]|uniref:Uncharacterized protein n=1 Tax=Aerococcus viridans TaxID=1377 RepID=A0A2N6UEB4_9LACT|nr:MetQ/NlpA family ABC transporter substrate-binding protein [Aerococcus viridans]PMC79918.1 hypothetical protein CJ191_03880 [Aerococcus viridans]
MKKLWWVLLLIPVMMACGHNEITDSGTNINQTEQSQDETTNKELVNLKVGVVSSITEDMWQNVADRLEEAGENIHLEPVLFSDFTAANNALSEGEIDISNFQYIPFMYTYNQEANNEIRPIGFSLVARLGLYASDKNVKSLEDIPNNAVIGMNEDDVSIGYIFHFLDSIGLITLADDVGAFPTEDDIIENTKNISFTYMPAAQLPRALQDLDLAVTAVSYFEDAGYAVDDALAMEDPKQTPPEYFLTIAVREKDLNNPDIQTVLSYYNDPKTDEYAVTINPIYTPVWQLDYDANQVYEDYALEQENH